VYCNRSCLCVFGGQAVSEPYYSQRARSVCVSLNAVFISYSKLYIVYYRLWKKRSERLKHCARWLAQAIRDRKTPLRQPIPRNFCSFPHPVSGSSPKSKSFVVFLENFIRSRGRLLELSATTETAIVVHRVWWPLENWCWYHIRWIKTATITGVELRFGNSYVHCVSKKSLFFFFEWLYDTSTDFTKIWHMKRTINCTRPTLKLKLHYRVKFGRFTSAVYNNTTMSEMSKQLLRRFFKPWSDFLFFTDEKVFTVAPPWTNTQNYRKASTSVSAVFCAYTRRAPYVQPLCDNVGSFL